MKIEFANQTTRSHVLVLCGMEPGRNYRWKDVRPNVTFRFLLWRGYIRRGVTGWCLTPRGEKLRATMRHIGVM